MNDEQNNPEALESPHPDQHSLTMKPDQKAVVNEFFRSWADDAFKDVILIGIRDRREPSDDPDLTKVEMHTLSTIGSGPALATLLSGLSRTIEKKFSPSAEEVLKAVETLKAAKIGPGVFGAGEVMHEKSLDLPGEKSIGVPVGEADEDGGSDASEEHEDVAPSAGATADLET